MLSKKVKTRLVFLGISFLFAAVLTFFTLKTLKTNIVYFLSPTDVYNQNDLNFNKKVRIGGLVKEGSILYQNTSIKFTITDLKNEIFVSYEGSIPNLFSEGKGVVVEGKLQDKKYFLADSIMAKHDENYTPPEVRKILKENKN
jgi:cytochrome c-type biogenesis protein CcmE